MRVSIKGLALIFLGFISWPLQAQTIQFVTSNDSYEVSNIKSDVDVFDFIIEIDAPLAAGLYDNPPIISVSYRVSGNLDEGTPSNFDVFALDREINGDEFYAQGSSLRFEISESAVLDDGVQVAELVGNEIVFKFDGKEIGNGRFHPALFELRTNGTGRIQNSNNTPTVDPLLEIEAGSEYVNDLIFDAANTTLIVEAAEINSPEQSSTSNGGGGLGMMNWFVLFCLFMALRWRMFSCCGRLRRARYIDKAIIEIK